MKRLYLVAADEDGSVNVTVLNGWHGVKRYVQIAPGDEYGNEVRAGLLAIERRDELADETEAVRPAVSATDA